MHQALNTWLIQSVSPPSILAQLDANQLPPTWFKENPVLLLGRWGREGHKLPPDLQKDAEIQLTSIIGFV